MATRPRRQHRDRPRRHQRAGLPDPGAEGTDPARGRRRGSPNAPAPSPGPTRSSSPPACNARSPPARVPRRRGTHPRRPVPRPQVPGGLRLRPRPRPQTRDRSPTWAPWTSSPPRRTWSSSARPGTGKTHLATGLAIRACQAGHRVLFATASQWVDRLADRPPRRPPAGRAPPPGPLPAAGHRRGRLHPVRTRSREPVLPARLLPLRTRLPDRHLATSPSAAGARSSATTSSPPP